MTDADASDANAAEPRPALQQEFTDQGPSSHRFRNFQESAADLVDMVRLGAPEDFRVSAETVHLGSALLVNARQSPMALHRTAAHVARSGIDLYQVVMYVAGSGRHESCGRVALLRPGDISVIDLAQPNRTFLGPSEEAAGSDQICLMLPRPVLAPLLAAPDSAGALVLSRDTPYGKLVGEHLMALRRYAAQLNDRESRAVVQATAHLVAGGIGSAKDAAPTVTQATRAALVCAIKQHIEGGLDLPDLGVDSLCSAFALSRPVLYRLFEPDGGVATYIQERRLYRAFEQLASPEHRTSRILDIALDAHFGSDASFIRAFRRQFGMTPGGVQRQAELARAGVTTAPLSAATAWVRHIGRDGSTS